MNGQIYSWYDNDESELKLLSVPKIDETKSMRREIQFREENQKLRPNERNVDFQTGNSW